MNIQHERVHQQILNILYAWGMGDDLAKTTAEAMVVASGGYDLPSFEKLTTFKVWAEEGPPKGTLYHYPNPHQHQIQSIAAAQGLLGFGAFKALGEIRGKWCDFDRRPLMVTYHPSYILREPTNRKKRMIWEDLLQVMERADLSISDRQRGYFLEK